MNIEITEENVLLTNKHLLICLDEDLQYLRANYPIKSKNYKNYKTHKNNNELYMKYCEYMKLNFCGNIITNLSELTDINKYLNFKNNDKTNNANKTNKTIYICGNTDKVIKFIINNNNSNINICDNSDNSDCFYDISIIKDLSYGDQIDLITDRYQARIISIGEVPINLYNLGIFIPKCFDDSNRNYFDEISNSHTFQNMSETNKPSFAFRKGIYITNITNEQTTNTISNTTINNSPVYFNLLRCSSNYSGPSDNIREVDREIMMKVNNISRNYYRDDVELNHTLAQIYKNSTIYPSLLKYIMYYINICCLFLFNKQLFNITQNIDPIHRKAKISPHSDKTKDMPRNATLVFNSFYDNYYNGKFNYKDNDRKDIINSNRDLFDYTYKNNSVLPKLRFRLKKVVENSNKNLVKSFDIILYPNSSFIIPLSTNRLYTHEIITPVLPSNKIPTRMGYVMRCSKTKAVHKNNKTYIIEDNNVEKELLRCDDNEMQKIKNLYLNENMTIDLINYDNIYTSMNNGDYMKPTI